MTAPTTKSNSRLASRHGELANEHSLDELEGHSDQELLRRFVQDRRQEAFTELVQRHSPMVMSVCRQVLRDQHDAEDVFQATFLILAQQADKIRRRQIAAWLHRVAYRAAVRLAKKRTRKGSPLMEDVAANDIEQWQAISTTEERHRLLSELDQLPPLYRQALVMCCLEGRSRADAARELDTSIEALQKRVSRGMQMLRIRLTRRGIIVGSAIASLVGSTTKSDAAELESLVSLTSEICTATVLESDSSIYLTKVGAIARQGAFRMSFVSAFGWLCTALFISGGLLLGGVTGVGLDRHGSAESSVGHVETMNVQTSATMLGADEFRPASNITGVGPANSVDEQVGETGEADGDKLAVLMLGEAPTWEWRFLQQALARHPQVELVYFLDREVDVDRSEGHDSRADEAESDVERELSREAFRSAIDDLEQFDVVILVLSPSRSLFEREPALAEELEAYVRDEQGGLIVSEPHSIADHPLSDVLPVTAADVSDDDVLLEGAYRMRIAEDARHPLTSWLDGADQGDADELQLPPNYRRVPVVRVDAEAFTWLGQSSGADESPIAAVVSTSSESRTNVLYVGTDETWRWRSLDGGRVYSEFWTRAINYVGQAAAAE